MRCASACGVAKLAAVKNRGPGRGKRPFQAWSALAAGAHEVPDRKDFDDFLTSDENSCPHEHSGYRVDVEMATKRALGLPRL